MAHPEQLRFVELVKSRFLGSASLKVLEIGSHDVNGSIRGFFPGADYTGVDLSPGIGVDVVASGHEVDFPEGTFDITLACECFEHNPYWRETFLNMHRMTKDRGVVVFTCASKGRFEHGTARTSPGASPGTFARGIDYYRNLNASDFRRGFGLDRLFAKHMFFYVPTSQDLYFIGWKKACAVPAADLERFASEVAGIADMRSKPHWRVRLISFIYRFPVWVAMNVCGDRAYQDFQLTYFRYAEKVKAQIRKTPSGR